MLFEASDMLHESEVLDIDTVAKTEDEVRKAIPSLKNGKAAGNDGIKAEMIKYGEDATIGQLAKLCNVIWTTGRIPTTWKDGIVIPLPKKGDLRECTNWRGITLKIVNPRKNHGQGDAESYETCCG